MSEHFAPAAADDARRAAGNGVVKGRSRGDVTHGRNGTNLAQDPAPNGAGTGPSGNGNGSGNGAGNGSGNGAVKGGPNGNGAAKAAGNGAAKERHRNGLGRSRPGGDAARAAGTAARPDWEGLLRVLREEVACLVKTVPGPLAQLAVRAGDCSFEITWGPAGGPAAGGVNGEVAAAGGGGAVPAPAGPVDAAQADEELETCAAPLVGTFYRSPAPGEAPFVEVGDRVEAGQPVGIIEAMKLMNEIPAACSGEVVDVLVPDAAPVEFGQPLVRIRPDQRPDHRADHRQD
ncbi:acetyl-CoA carboxylase biotin carboxyl carrier protein [Actinomadura sp. NPDC047616]|uniref:acetyl-CoA carboxylase biotin carboxyl carrier protein n=1 Tax=Actinomadura sp. NPDC047616 TaxID=3155914 RepID=UPI0033D76CE2